MLARIAHHKSTANTEARDPANCPEGTRRVRIALEFIRRNYRECPRIGDLASQAGLSVFHFIRVFRVVAGVTPHQFLNRVRVERAHALLQRGVSPSLVAHEVGFSDQSHLTRQFKRILGTTPKKARR